METRGNRQNYFALNDCYDNEALPEDQLSSPTSGNASKFSAFTQPELNPFIDNPTNVEINPSESASQTLSYPTTAVDSSIVSYASQNPPSTTNCSQPTTKEAWFRAYFSKHEVAREWYTKKHKKRKLVDMDIQCSIMDQVTGKQCSWATTDSKRQSSTSNLVLHLLRKHSIYPPGVSNPEPVKNP